MLLNSDPPSAEITSTGKSVGIAAIGISRLSGFRAAVVTARPLISSPKDRESTLLGN